MARFSAALCAVAFVLALSARYANAQEIKILAGYRFDTNVTEHARLDLDQRDMEVFADKFDWTGAEQIYGNGKHSKKSTTTRTLKGFSTEADTKMAGEGYFELFKKYYKVGDYGDRFITGALDGLDDFAGKGNVFRSECANKGSQYQNVWMYVIHELEDAINDCFENNLKNNDKGVKAWDEGWAFYAGSLEGADGQGSGFFIHALAEKRCIAFNVCTGQSGANVNRDLLALFNQGRDQINKLDCAGAIKTKNLIVRKMTIPLVQGLFRYVVFTKNDKKPKSHAEGLAFARGFLPILDHCNKNAATVVARNFDAKADPPMSDSIAVVANAVYAQLGCMGISCAELGQWDQLPVCKTETQFKLVPGTDKASKDNKKSAPTPTGPGTSGADTPRRRPA